MFVKSSNKKSYESIPNFLYAWNLAVFIDMRNVTLDKLWLCRECNVKFIFFSDVKEHIRMKGHIQITEFDLVTGQTVTS